MKICLNVISDYNYHTNYLYNIVYSFKFIWYLIFANVWCYFFYYNAFYLNWNTLVSLCSTQETPNSCTNGFGKNRLNVICQKRRKKNWIHNAKIHYLWSERFIHQDTAVNQEHPEQILWFIISKCFIKVLSKLRIW